MLLPLDPKFLGSSSPDALALNPEPQAVQLSHLNIGA